jgi:hypothetical protein
MESLSSSIQSHASQLAKMGKNYSKEQFSKMTNKALSLYLTKQFVGELMKNIDTKNQSFSSGTWHDFFVDSISEAIALKDGFGFEGFLKQKNTNINQYLKKEGNTKNAPIDILI